MALRPSLIAVLCGLLLGAGCVSRTTERTRRTGEVLRGGADADGRVVTRDIIWFWEPGFRRR